MDDFRLAPILEDASLFSQHGQDLLSLDLPPIQESGSSRAQASDIIQDPPVTPTRAKEAVFEPQGSDSSPPSTRKTQHDASTTQSTLPIAKVLNRDQGQDQFPTIKQSAQESSHGPAQSLQLPQPNIHHPPDSQIPRIPPLLQGLHDPPPDAGLFPRITDDQGRKVTRHSLAFVDKAPARHASLSPGRRPTTTKEVEIASRPDDSLSDSGKERQRRTAQAPQHPRTRRVARRNKKWTKEETLDLLRGVAMHGVGKWKEIRNDSSLRFEGRSHIDLKDRYRVCCAGKGKAQSDQVPSQSSVMQPNSDLASSVPGPADSMSSNSCKRGRGDASSKPSTDELATLGISKEQGNKPNNCRRQRHAFSASEDAVILSGYEKHGAQWAKIMEHPELKEAHRNRGDVRDRWRVLSKRRKVPKAQPTTNDKKHASDATRTPMKLDHIIAASIDAPHQQLQRGQGQVSTSGEQALVFVDPAVTWKPANVPV